MVIIRVNGRISPQQAEVVTEAIHMQAASGVIVVPHFCELLNEVPAGEEIQVLYQDTRVAELEKELEHQKKKTRDLQERLCRNCSYRAGKCGCPLWDVCENGDMFRPKGGGV